MRLVSFQLPTNLTAGGKSSVFPPENQRVIIRFPSISEEKHLSDSGAKTLLFAPLPDKIVCEPRAKTGVCVLYKVGNPSASPRGSTYYEARKSPLSFSVHNILLFYSCSYYPHFARATNFALTK